jgi:hypothetical protein
MDATLLVAHVTFAALAFGLAIVVDLVLTRIARTGDPATIRKAYRAAFPVAITIGPMFGLTLLLGLGLGLERHESLLQPWLLVAYALFAIGVILGAGVNRSKFMRIAAAAEHSPDGTPSPELSAAIAGATPVVAILTVVLLVALLADMFLKPFMT